MSTKSRRRLMTDYKALMKEENYDIAADPDQNNLMLWYAIILGPDDTPWEGGVFKLKLEFTEEYPNKPPVVKFLTQMYHPNIYLDGKICLDILQKEWSPIYNVASILTSIQSLLSDPNTDSPANSEAAKIYDSDKYLYYDKVRECVVNSLIIDPNLY
jgi:ubiquitin-conjugating enzyme E2 A